eukprot:2678820-Amphidinium_carterae.1
MAAAMRQTRQLQSQKFFQRHLHLHLDHLQKRVFQPLSSKSAAQGPVEQPAAAEDPTGSSKGGGRWVDNNSCTAKRCFAEMGAFDAHQHGA